MGNCTVIVDKKYSFIPGVAEDSKGKMKEMSGLVAVESHSKPLSQTW